MTQTQRGEDGTFSADEKKKKPGPPKLRKLGNRVSYVCTLRSRRVVQRFRKLRELPSDSQAFDALMAYVCELDVSLIPSDEA